MMTDLQSTNRVAIAKVRETTFGVTTPNPVFKGIRETSSSLAVNPQTVVSNEISPDRQVSDLILVGVQAGGDVGGEMSFQTMDDDLEEALQGTWANLPNIVVATLDTEISDLSVTTATVAAGLGTPFKTGMLVLTSGFTTPANNGLVARVASSTGTVVFPAATFTAEPAPIPVGATMRTVGFAGVVGDIAAVTAGGNAMTSATLDFTTLGLQPGLWIRPNGFATAVNNDFCRVSAVAANKISLDRVPVGWAADTGAAVAISVFAGDFLTNGSTKRSNTFERQYLDHVPVTYEYLRGQTVDKFSVTADANKIATYTESYIGSDGVAQTIRIAGATDVPAPTNDVLNTSSNVGRLGFDGVPVTGPNFIMSAKFDIANNLRRQNAVGSFAPVGIGNGEFTVTGTLNTYFGSKAVLDKVINNTRTSFDTRLGRPDNNKQSLVFDFPSIKLSAGAPSVSGKNADVMLSATFQALRDPTLGYTLGITRFWYLP